LKGHFINANQVVSSVGDVSPEDKGNSSFVWSTLSFSYLVKEKSWQRDTKDKSIWQN
jgi:hypothetical protein